MFHSVRLIAASLALVALAACDETVTTAMSTQAGAPVIADTVTIDTSAFAGIEGRTISKSKAQVAADLQGALSSALSGPGAGNADVTLRLTTVQLTSPGSAFAFGGPSRIIGTLTVTDATTGATIFGPQEVRGNSETVRLPGVIGAATSPSVTNDYNQTVQGFAATVRNLVRGTPTDAQGA